MPDQHHDAAALRETRLLFLRQAYIQAVKRACGNDDAFDAWIADSVGSDKKQNELSSTDTLHTLITGLVPAKDKSDKTVKAVINKRDLNQTDLLDRIKAQLRSDVPYTSFMSALDGKAQIRPDILAALSNDLFLSEETLASGAGDPLDVGIDLTDDKQETVAVTTDVDAPSFARILELSLLNTPTTAAELKDPEDREAFADIGLLVVNAFRKKHPNSEILVRSLRQAQENGSPNPLLADMLEQLAFLDPNGFFAIQQNPTIVAIKEMLDALTQKREPDMDRIHPFFTIIKQSRAIPAEDKLPMITAFCAALFDLEGARAYLAQDTDDKDDKDATPS